MHIDPALPTIVRAILSILLVSFALRALGQPRIVGYIASSRLPYPVWIGICKALLGRPEGKPERPRIA